MRRIIKQYGLIIVTFLFFILVLLINNAVPLYGDDFAYRQFTKKGFEYYIQRHAEHYFLANGRIIVHVLATLFLSTPHIFWALFNSLMLSGIVFFGARVAGRLQRRGDSPDFWAGIILLTSIAILSPDITRQSVYWLTGSFNYVYPAVMLFIYWYLIDRPVYEQKPKWLIPVFALLASATVEQISLMVVGLSILILLERAAVKKQKPEAVLVIALAAALVGAASILLSPSMAYRASVEDAPVAGIWNLIRYNLKNQGTTFLFSKIMQPYHLLAMISALGTIFSYSRKITTKPFRFMGNSIMPLGVTAFACWVWQVMSREAQNNYSIVEPRQVVFYLLIGFGYMLTLLYASLLTYKESGASAPFIAIILCAGSQLMMVVSPVYGPRNLLSAIFMLALYSASLMPALHDLRLMTFVSCMVCFLFNLTWLVFLPVSIFMLETSGVEQKKMRKETSFRLKNMGAVMFYMLLIFISGATYVQTLRGYGENARVYTRNLETAEIFNYNTSKGELIQYKLVDEKYGWVMPYHNAYYEPYYKLTIGVDVKTKIIWQEFE